MPDFKDLTDFLSYLQIVRKSTSSDCPRFALSFSSKLQGSFLINQLLGFPLFPEKFSNKLASIELVLRASIDTLSTKNPTFELDGINEKFHCLEEFRTRFVHHILSFPQQNYTESVTVSVSMASIPSFSLLILPDIQSEQSDELEYESIKKKIVKKALRDPNNLIICVSDIQDDLNISQPVEYLRQYDPYGSRTLLVFIDSEMSSMQDDSQKLALQKILTEQEFPIKHGFVLFNKLPFQNQFNTEQRGDQVECKNFSNESEDNKTNAITMKERESLFLAMKEMTLYTVRGVFPGLLDELKDIQRDLQARLDWLNEDGTQRGYNIKIEGIKPALDIGLQLRKEFQDEACSTVNYVTKERTTTMRKTSTNEPEVNKAISRIKAETDSDYVRSIDSLESQGDEVIVLMETVPFGFRINEIFANLYKSEANKDDIARFTILADDEIKNVFQTSQSRTVNDFVKSQGFKALVTSRLNWIIGCTCESVWNIHEAVSSTLVKQIEKYYIKLPILRDTIKHELKGFIQETRETTVKALMPVLNSHINYVYCKDPVKVFGDLYEVPSAKGKRKNSFKPETSLVILIQQLSEACRLYCQSIIDSLGEIVPRMVGQLYLSEILQNIGRKMEACIDNLANENPEALKSIDPYQAERDILEQKLMMTEKAKKFILHEPSLKQVVWIEGLNSEKISPEIPERPSETETSATTCDNTDVSKMNRKQWVNDDLHVKRLNSDTVGSQSDIFKGPTASYSVDEERVNEDEYEVMKGMVENLNLDLNKIDSTSNLPSNKPKMRKESIQEDFKTQDDNQRTDTEGDEVQRSTQGDMKTSSMPILSDTNNVGCNLNGKPNNYQDICFEGVEIIEDYWSRLQKHEEKIFRKKDWLIQIESRSLVDIDSSRLFPSLYYGINTDIRGSVWKVIANVKELRARHPKGYYEELSSTPSENWDYVIAKDVPRTLIDEPFFKNSQYQGDVKLKQILRAYAHYDPDLGYTQGMNALAGIILMVMCGYKPNTNPAKYKRVSKSCERNSFWILVYIMKEKGYRDSFLDSYPRLMENLKSFEKVMMRKTPWALAHLTKSGVSVESAFMHQFLTAGGQHAPLELFLRIMDIFMVKGEAVLFELILKALELCKKEILSVKDEKLFKFLKHDILYLALKKCGGDMNKLLSYVDEV